MATAQSSNAVVEVTSNWTTKLRAGDLIQNKRTGSIRAVRQYHAKPDSMHGSGYVTFAIKRCSWTRKCYTVYCSSEIRNTYRPLHKRISLRGNLDKAIQRAILGNGKLRLTCDDVYGAI